MDMKSVFLSRCEQIWGKQQAKGSKHEAAGGGRAVRHISADKGEELVRNYMLSASSWFHQEHTRPAEHQKL